MKITAFHIILFAILFWSCQSSETEVKVLRVGLSHSNSHSFTLALEEFKKEVETNTQGKIQIKIYPSSQLGNESEMQEMLMIGSLDMALAGLVNNHEPLFSVLELPYLYENREHVKAVNNGPILEDLARSLNKFGIRLIGWYENGFRHLTTSIKPIHQPEDLNGLLIRTTENMAHIQTIKALGGIPTPLSYAELYTALTQGMVDGQENPLQNIWTGKLYETQKYVAMTGHIFNCAYVLISERTWNKLDKEQQNIIRSAIKNSIEWQLAYLEKLEKELQEKIELEGVEFTFPDKSLFKAKTLPVYDYFINLYGEDAENLINKINALKPSENN
ncbi:TRAP transporter substrate-binding protein [Shivajiella indica]|uniref:TRAP transporter substrate-binding protein n=1 Tax=Shivajiella indica TaxID=872115 RepID=A0ABW5B2Q9_9BACT